MPVRGVYGFDPLTEVHEGEENEQLPRPPVEYPDASSRVSGHAIRDDRMRYYVPESEDELYGPPDGVRTGDLKASCNTTAVGRTREHSIDAQRSVATHNCHDH